MSENKSEIKDEQANLEELEKEPEVITKPTPKRQPKIKKAEFIVVHAIFEDKTEFKPGMIYTGKFAEKFLKDGQIRRKDK